MVSLEHLLLDDHVEGAVNLRDLGGFVAGEHRVRRGRLFRSGMMHHLTPAGLQTLVARYGLRAVVDLRGVNEREADGVTPFESVQVTVHHVALLDAVMAPRDVQEQRLAEMRAGTYDWGASYVRMARECGAGFRRIFALAADVGAYPLVFHCTAGRDRTGVTAALMLKTLGVSDDDVARDYARTGDFLRPHAPRFIKPSGRMKLTVAEMERLLETREEAMHAFLSALRHEYGSADGYLDSIGVSAGERDALRAHLLEPASRPTAGM